MARSRFRHRHRPGCRCRWRRRRFGPRAGNLGSPPGSSPPCVRAPDRAPLWGQRMELTETPGLSGPGGPAGRGAEPGSAGDTAGDTVRLSGPMTPDRSGHAPGRGLPADAPPQFGPTLQAGMGGTDPRRAADTGQTGEFTRTGDSGQTSESRRGGDSGQTGEFRRGGDLARPVNSGAAATPAEPANLAALASSAGSATSGALATRRPQFRHVGDPGQTGEFGRPRDRGYGDPTRTGEPGRAADTGGTPDAKPVRWAGRVSREPRVGSGPRADRRLPTSG